ncbi:hypothetical protein GP420_002291 [Enterococcus faecalis]|nr:hypothetical protein [Enterococcus faecalis]
MIPDELASMFLTKVQLQKLKILSKMQYEKVDLLSLQNEIDGSKRQVKDIIKDINEDIEGDVSIEITEGIIKFNKKIEHSEYIEIVNNCRILYVVSSSFFQLMLFVLEKRSFSIVQAAQNLSYSESYVYKLVNKLRGFFKQLDAGFQLDKKNETTIQLVGCESTIRLFHYLSVSTATKGNHWAFNTINEEEILNIQKYLNSDRYERLSPIGKNKANFILAVYESAFKNKRKISLVDKDLINLGETINKEKEITLLLNYLKEERMGTNRKLHSELIHLAFFANHFIEELRIKKEKIIIGEKIYRLKRNNIVKSCVKILDNILKKISIESDVYYLLLYNLCNRVVVINHLCLYKFMPLYNVPPLGTDLEYFVENCVKSGLSDYRNNPSFSKLKYNLTQVIIGYLVLIVPTPKKIFVEFFHRPAYKSIIENAIEHNYNNDALQITDDYSEADVIISDTGGYENKQYFYFKDVFDQNSWYELGFYLNQIISKQITENNYLDSLNHTIR